MQSESTNYYKKQTWMTKEIIEIMEERRQLRNKNNTDCTKNIS